MSDPTAFGFNTPFYEQIEFFRRKLNLPSERWDDIRKAAHDRAFIVAGVMKADLLGDLRQAVDKGIATGTTLETFRKDFRGIVAKHGWTGWTGEGSPGGFAWRTRVIYETNVRTSHAAGRWAQLTHPDLLKQRPFWRYVHADSVMHPRPHHQRWGNLRLTLPHDHPFWKTHFPPNGWGCRCRVTAVTGPQDGDATVPPEGWDEPDSKGLLPGIDRGWDYAPGANAARPLKEFIDAKLIALDAPIGAAMWRELTPVLAIEERAAAFGQWVDDVISAGHARGQHRVAGAMTRREIDYYAEAVGAAPATAEIAIEDRLLVGKKATRHANEGNALSIAEWKSLPAALENQRKTYFDKLEKKMIYVLPSLDDRSIKLAVQVDFVTGRPKQAINAARAGYKINAQALDDRTRYEEIE